METIFRKVSVKGRLPKKEGIYLVNNGQVWFEAIFDHNYSFHGEFTDCSSVEYWMEEIKLPADKEIKKLAKQYSQSYWGEVPGDTLKDLKSSFEGYGRYLLNKLKS